MTNSTGPIDHLKSRTKDSDWEAGLSPRSSWNCSARTANTRPTMDWPASFALARRPSERRLTTLM